jgi:hypothetical protein
MRITKIPAAALVVTAFIAFCNEPSLLAQQPAKSGLTMAEFEKLHKELQPPNNELWRTIPWQVSILEGRELAAKTKKPIFVWVASGEPLGCG